MLDFLEQEQISKELLEGIRKYRNAYPTPPKLQNRIPKPRYHYYGKEVWEASIAALLCGENLLLAGSKATGKMCWRKIWPKSLRGQAGMYPFM